MNPELEFLAGNIYRAFVDDHESIAMHTGRRFPEWDDLPEIVRKQWRTAVTLTAALFWDEPLPHQGNDDGTDT